MKTVWIDRIDMSGKIRPHNTWRKVDVPNKANYITASDTGYLWHELNPVYHELTKEWHSDGDRGALRIDMGRNPPQRHIPECIKDQRGDGWFDVRCVLPNKVCDNFAIIADGDNNVRYDECIASKLNDTKTWRKHSNIYRFWQPMPSSPYKKPVKMTQDTLQQLWSEWATASSHLRFGQYVFNQVGYELNNSYNDIDPREVFNKIKDAIK